MSATSAIYSFGTMLLDLLSGKNIPPAHVCLIQIFQLQVEICTTLHTLYFVKNLAYTSNSQESLLIRRLQN